MLKVLRRCLSQQKQIVYDVDGSNQQYLSSILQYAVKNDYLSSQQPSALIIDINAFRSRCSELHDAFNKGGLRDNLVKHTYALKALQLPALINEINNYNMGIECASFGELSIALSSNTSTCNIVYDSPCKTYNELQYGLENNIFMNLDNFQELERVNHIITENKNKNKNIDINKIKIGIRVNPVIGEGDIAATSTATKYSKFGINLNENRDNLLKSYRKYKPWLNAIHAHIGSQGCSIQMISDGIYKVIEFVEEMNKNEMLINTIDIGGGLAVNYNESIHKPTFYDLVDELKKTVPEIFSNKYKIYTEFGRALIQKCGYLVSKVEYTKQTGDKNIAIVHCGGNTLVREVYNPQIWKHYISIYDAEGKLKVNNKENKLYKYDIVGPLCFSGDIIGNNLYFPFEINPNDYIVIHDCGGYTLGMYSIYNSRQFPPIFGFDNAKKQNDNEFFRVLKSQQTNENVVQFWMN